MRHTSFTLLALLLGCSGTPVSAPELPVFPILQPVPTQQSFGLTHQTKDAGRVLAYIDAIDTYIIYLKDYSRRIAEEHNFKSGHIAECPIVLTGDPIVVPSPPITTGMDETQTIDALVTYIGVLRNTMQQHNRTEQILKDKANEFCAVR